MSESVAANPEANRKFLTYNRIDVGPDTRGIYELTDSPAAAALATFGAADINKPCKDGC